jgi:hypothetical protein
MADQPAKKTTSGKPGAQPKGARKTVQGAAKRVATTGPQGKVAGAAIKATERRQAPRKSTPGKVAGLRVTRGRKLLLAELVVCIVLLGLSGVTGTASKTGTQTDLGSRLAVKGSALAGVFIVLGLVSSGGRSAEKAAGALGLLITLAYMFEERDVFTALSTWAKGAGK